MIQTRSCMQLDEVKKDPLQQLLHQNSPDVEMTALRKSALHRLQKIVHEACGSCCEVKIFGSVASGTDLKTSDLDVVVASTPHVEPQTLLDVLERKFKTLIKGQTSTKQSGTISNDLVPATADKDAPLIVAIRGAKIPLLKIDKRLWGVDLDISFNSTDGLTNTQFVKTLVKLPQLKPLQMLVRLVKLWKNSRDLPDARCFGLGSFPWLLMAAFALQSTRSNNSSPEAALRVFFNCFAKFNYHTSAVSVRDNRGVAVAKPWQMHDAYRPARLVVLDPCTHPLAPPRNVISGLRTAQMILVHAELQRAAKLLQSGKMESVLSSNGVSTLTDRLARFQPATPTAPPAPPLDLVVVIGRGRSQASRVARVVELKWRDNAPSPSTRDVIRLQVRLFAPPKTERGTTITATTTAATATTTTTATTTATDAKDRPQGMALNPDVIYVAPADVICVADMQPCPTSDSLWHPTSVCQERLTAFESSLLSLRSAPAKRQRADLRSADVSRMRFSRPQVQWMPPRPRGFWPHPAPPLIAPPLIGRGQSRPQGPPWAIMHNSRPLVPNPYAYHRPHMTHVRPPRQHFAVHQSQPWYAQMHRR